MCKILNHRIIFCSHFSLIAFSGAGGTNVFGYNGTFSQCQHHIDSLFGHFTSRLRRISPKYCFDRLVASYSLFVPCSQKYTYLLVCICSPLLIYSPNVPHPSSQCAPGMGHNWTVEMHFLKGSHTNHVCTTIYQLTQNMDNMLGFSKIRYHWLWGSHCLAQIPITDFCPNVTPSPLLTASIAPPSHSKMKKNSLQRKQNYYYWPLLSLQLWMSKIQ